MYPETMCHRSLILLLALFVAMPALARHGDEGRHPPDPERRVRDHGGGDGLDAAIARIRAETGGRVLSAEPASRDGRSGYRIKLLTPDDRIRILFVPAD
ncbi:MAG TPA: hypothetical protein ENK00_04880 [Chromatiales bacterium]|nr:hypothetical protein [Chromatiales bacterium]